MSFVRSQMNPTPSGWQSLSFDQAFEDATGGNAKVQTAEYLPAGRLRIIDQGRSESAGFVDDVSLACKATLPCIIFGDHTRALKWVTTPFVLGADGVKVLVPRGGLDARFAFHYLRTIRLPEDLGYSRHFKYLKEITVPLPPLPEQRRIAAILDKSDTIRRKRQGAIALTDELLLSAFLEMFGDPVANPKGWRLAPLQDLVAEVTAGWSANGEARPHVEGEYGVLKVSAVTSGWYKPEENKAVMESSANREMVIPRRGDLLFSRANTRELVAATCIVTTEDDYAFLPDKLWRISTKMSALTAEYLAYVLKYDRFRDTLRSVATGTSGSMLNISQAKLLDAVIPVPPIFLQRDFAQFFWKAIQLRDRLRAGAALDQVVGDALVDRAFSGDL